MTGELPTCRQATELDVVGASVSLIVGEAVLPLAGEDVGYGVGDNVVLCISCISSASRNLPVCKYRPISIAAFLHSTKRGY